MKTKIALPAVLLVVTSVLAAADEKPAPTIEGKYTLVSGKKFGADPDDEAKKAKYTVTKDTFTIDGKDAKFVIGYKLEPKIKPMGINLEIQEGPEGTKGSKALGIVDVKADELVLAYSLDKDRRPRDFEGKEGMLFVLKRVK